MPRTCPWMALVTGPNYFLLPTHVFDVGCGNSVEHDSGGVGGVLALPNTMHGE